MLRPRASLLTAAAVCGLLTIALTGCSRRDNPQVCRTNAECLDGDLMYRCNETTFTCATELGPIGATCAGPSDCHDPALPVCFGGVCGWCSAAEDPDAACLAISSATPACDRATGRCVACTRTEHCPNTAPICDRTVCRKCIEDSECTGRPGAFQPGICENYYYGCVPANRVIVVENKDGCTTEKGPGAGTEAQPLCHAQLGVDQYAIDADAREYIVVRGNLSSIFVATRLAGTIYIVGQNGARLTTTTSEVLRNSSSSNMVVRNVELDVPAGATGIRLDQGGSMYLTAVKVVGRPGSGVGISAESFGQLTIVRSLIMGNEGGGITTLATDFEIRNTIIANNGAVGATLTSDADDARRFRFINNTVIGNAITCASALSLKNSIIWDGGRPAVSRCALQFSTTVDPHLDADFHLTAASVAQIDQADPNDYAVGDYDSVTGRAPAPGGKPDIGADEYQP